MVGVVGAGRVGIEGGRRILDVRGSLYELIRVYVWLGDGGWLLLFVLSESLRVSGGGGDEGKDVVVVRLLLVLLVDGVVLLVGVGVLEVVLFGIDV